MFKLIPALAVLAIAICSPIGAQDKTAKAKDETEKSEDSNEEEEAATAEDILTLNFIKDALGFDGEIEDEPSTNETSTYTSCTYRWKAEAKRKVEVAGTEIEVDDENSIGLSVSIVGEGKGKQSWERATKRFTADEELYDEIEGIGDEAIWVKDAGQICVREGDHMFFLTVHYPDGDDENVDYAKDMAQKILDKLKE